jgi:hypothetical protein
MKTYLISFKGRESGAIGTFQSYSVMVAAHDEREAILKLYDTYEHITHTIIDVITEGV